MDNVTEPAPDMHSGAKTFAETHGLSLLSALLLIVADNAVFVVLEIPSLGVLAIVSAVVACLLVPTVAMLQKHVYGDAWGAAWAKALACGVIMAIPTSMASIFTMGWGVLGAIGAAESRAARRNGRSASRPEHNNERSNRNREES